MEMTKKEIPDNELLKYKGTSDKPDIKIFVSTRIDEDSECVDNPIFRPVRCGAVYDTHEKITIFGDDTGDNISEKRLTFNEFTVMYWAWKNIKADYYGLCHYRRYLNFSEDDFEPIAHKIAYFDALTHSTMEKCGLLNQHAMYEQIQKYDLVTTMEYDVISDSSPSLRDAKSAYEWWLKYNPNYISKTSFEILFSLIKEKFQEYYESAEEYKNGRKFRGFNCFVLKSEYFFSICEFIFGILFDFEKLVTLEHPSDYSKRVVGYVGEWLYSIWIYHHKKKGIKIKENRLVTFLKSEKSGDAPSPCNENSISILFSGTVWNVADIAVCMQSIIDNANDKRNYDIVILKQSQNASDRWGTYLDNESYSVLKTMVAEHSNISISFYDPKNELGELNDHLYQKSISEEKYYPFLAAWILKFHEKVIYLNSKTLIQQDIAQLFDENIEDCYIGASLSLPFQIWLNGYDSKNENDFKKNAKNILHLKNIYEYFSSDVLLLNLKKIRQDFSQDEIINFLKKATFNNFVEDGLNILFDDKKHIFSLKYNKMEFADIPSASNMPAYLPSEVYKEWRECKPVISNLKTMTNEPLPMHSCLSVKYWQVARRTPFYEMLMNRKLDMLLEMYNKLQQSVSHHFSIKKTIIYRALKKAKKLILNKVRL